LQLFEITRLECFLLGMAMLNHASFGLSTLRSEWAPESRYVPKSLPKKPLPSFCGPEQLWVDRFGPNLTVSPTLIEPLP